jgi:hypothetical protein
VSCPYKHAELVQGGGPGRTGTWSPPDNSVLILRENGRGWRGYYTECRHCRERSPMLPKAAWQQWMIDFRLPVVATTW